MKRIFKVSLISIFAIILAFCAAFTAYADGILQVISAREENGIIYVEAEKDGIKSDFSLKLDDYVDKNYTGEYISIQAVDSSGNKSGIIQIENPYYVPETSQNVEETKIIEVKISDDYAKTEEKLNKNSFTPDGSGTILDSISDGNKEFLTIKTPDGNIFYLIIDKTKNTQNVYFLNEVTEEDLYGLAQKKGSDSTKNNGGLGNLFSPKTENNLNENEQIAEQTNVEEISPKSKKSSNNYNTLIIPAIIGIVVGVIIYFVKRKSKKSGNFADKTEENEDDEDDEDDENDYYNDEDEMNNYPSNESDFEENQNITDEKNSDETPVEEVENSDVNLYAENEKEEYDE